MLGSSKCAIALINTTRKLGAAVFFLPRVTYRRPAAPRPFEVGASRESRMLCPGSPSARNSSSCPGLSLGSKLFHMELHASRCFASLSDLVFSSLASLDESSKLLAGKDSKKRALPNGRLAISISLLQSSRHSSSSTGISFRSATLCSRLSLRSKRAHNSLLEKYARSGFCLTIFASACRYPGT